MQLFSADATMILEIFKKKKCYPEHKNCPNAIMPLDKFSVQQVFALWNWDNFILKFSHQLKTFELLGWVKCLKVFRYNSIPRCSTQFNLYSVSGQQPSNYKGIKKCFPYVNEWARSVLSLTTLYVSEIIYYSGNFHKWCPISLGHFWPPPHHLELLE